MNMKLLNLEEAFPKIMRAKLRSSGKGDRAVKAGGRVGHAIAKRPAFGKKFTNSIASKLTDLMPPQLEENGISFKLTQVHCGEMGFVVLRAEVLEVDILKLLESAKGTDFANKLSPIVGAARWFRDIDRDIVPKVQSVMMQKLEDEIPKKLWDTAHLRMLMICKPSAEQAEFFFDALAPHKMEVALSVLNKAEAAPKVAAQNAQGYFGDKPGRGKLLGMLASKVASGAAANFSDERFSKAVIRRLAQVLPSYLSEVGVIMTITDGLTSKDNSCESVLRCDIIDVDLSAFRAAGAQPAGMAQDQEMLKLGHKGREEVYEEVRNFIRMHFAQYLLKEIDLQVEITVRDIEKGEPPEMTPIEGLSDSDEEPEVDGK